MKDTARTKKTNMEEAWSRVRALKPLVLEHGHQGDTLRRLPDAIAQAFLKADVYRFQVPEALGGFGLDPLTTFDLCIELASYDGSVGWNYAVGGTSINMIGSLPVERLKHAFDTPDCCISGSVFPPGKAIATDGGYRFSGRWGWASCVHQAKWVNGAAFIYDGEKMRLDDGKPVLIMAQFPREDVTIHDAWYTSGMKGTGSTEYSVEDKFVSESELFRPFSKPSYPAPIFRLPSTYFGMHISGVAIGIAKGTVEAFKAFLQQDQTGLKNQGHVQYAAAKAEALYESSRENVKAAFRPLWEDALADRPATIDSRARGRRSYVLAAESAIEAVTLCYHAAGGAAVFDRNPFHRNLNDVYAVSAHRVLQRSFMELSGQAALGIPVGTPVF